MKVDGVIVITGMTAEEVTAARAKFAEHLAQAEPRPPLFWNSLSARQRLTQKLQIWRYRFSGWLFGLLFRRIIAARKGAGKDGV